MEGDWLGVEGCLSDAGRSMTGSGLGIIVASCSVEEREEEEEDKRDER